jgi:hypothetical protein
MLRQVAAPLGRVLINGVPLSAASFHAEGDDCDYNEQREKPQQDLYRDLSALSPGGGLLVGQQSWISIRQIKERNTYGFLP